MKVAPSRCVALATVIATRRRRPGLRLLRRSLGSPCPDMEPLSEPFRQLRPALAPVLVIRGPTWPLLTPDPSEGFQAFLNAGVS